MATLNPAQLQVHQLGLTCKDGRKWGEFGKTQCIQKPIQSPNQLEPIGPKPHSDHSTQWTEALFQNTVARP